jgi:Dehydrogenases with different specificities (related to short-chain alcohol dehydrogenases)
MELVKGKTAVITRAASGIGAATSHRMADEGATGLMLVDIDLQRAWAIADEIMKDTTCRCLAIQADVSSEVDAGKVFEKAADSIGGIDILVNSAGICKLADLYTLTMEQWDRTMNINLKGTFLFSREALKVMKIQKRGKIINVASQAGKIGGLIVGPDYPASKAGVLCLTKTLAKAAAPYNINVNSVAPGLIGTEMTKDFGYDESLVPLGRIGSPEEVADAILFLASDMSRYITGACIDVNGGMTMW